MLKLIGQRSSGLSLCHRRLRGRAARNRTAKRPKATTMMERGGPSPIVRGSGCESTPSNIRRKIRCLLRPCYARPSRYGQIVDMCLMCCVFQDRLRESKT